MGKSVRVAGVAEIPPGTGKECVAGGRLVAVFNVEGTFYALDGVCPHQGGPLGKGTVEQGVLTCPWHGWQFDVRTGEHLLNSQICQARMEVHVKGDDIFVTIEDAG